MFWSYVPLIATGIVAVAFALKMPIEVSYHLTIVTFFRAEPTLKEQLMIENPIIGPEYVQYKQKVTSRIIPGIW